MIHKAISFGNRTLHFSTHKGPFGFNWALYGARHGWYGQILGFERRRILWTPWFTVWLVTEL